MLRTVELLPAAEARLKDKNTLQDSSAPWLAGSENIVKREEIDRSRQAADVLCEARHQAERMLADAQQQTHQAQAAGFHHGVKQGISASLVPILAMVSEWDTFRAHLRENAAAAVRRCLADLVKRDSALVALLDEILAAHVTQRPDRVSIRIPRGAASQALQARCEALKLSATITEGDRHDEFSIEWDGHVWSAHLAEIASLPQIGQTDEAVAVSSTQAREMCRQAFLDAAHAMASDT